MQPGALRLAHRWTLLRGPGFPHALVREFIRPAVRAVPVSMARRLGHCRISLDIPDATVASLLTETEAGLEVSVMTAGSEDHDIAMELLLCLGQALWEKLFDGELRQYWLVLDQEIRAGISGEIDEQALEEKRHLLASRVHARSRRLSTSIACGMRSRCERDWTIFRRRRCAGGWSCWPVGSRRTEVTGCSDDVQRLAGFMPPPTAVLGIATRGPVPLPGYR